MNFIKSILVVCLGNICRSPYGEAKLKNLLSNDQTKSYKISSAGIYAMLDEPANSNSIQIAKDRGIDLSGHIAKQLTYELVVESDLILVMEKEHKNIIQKMYPFACGKIHCLGHWRNEEIQDPYGKPYAAYTHMANRMDVCLADWIDKIK